MANTVSFGQIVDPEEQAIERRRALAQALMLQSQQPFQQETAGGMTVPRSPMEGFAKIAQSLVSTKLNKDADAKQNEYIAKQGQNVSDFVTALSGKAATPGFQTGGNEMGDEPVMQKGTPAIAPDTAKAMAIALRTPGLQGQAGSLIEQQSVMGLINRLRGNSGAPTGDAGVAPGASGATGSSPFANVSPEVMALTLSSNPGAQKLGGILQDTTKPIALREGDLVRPNGQGGYSSVYQAPKLEPGIVPQRDASGQVIGAQAIPNYAPAAASIKGAEAGAVAGAQAGQEMVTVNTPQGPKMMTRAQAVQLAGGGAPAAGGAPIAPPVAPQPVVPQPGLPRPTAGNPPPGSGVVPAESPQARMVVLQQQLVKRQQALADPNMNDADRQRLLDDTRDIQSEMARMGTSNGKPNGLAPQGGIPLQTEGQQKFEQTMGTEQAQILSKGFEAAKTAADDILGIGQSRNALKSGVFTGPGADLKLTLTKFINANVPGVTIAADKAADTDYLKSQLGQGLLEKAKTLGSNPSNADAARINDIVGSIGKDPNALAKILDWRQQMAERAIQMHNGRVGQAVKNGFTPQFDMTVKMPSAPAAPAGGGFRIIGVQ